MMTCRQCAELLMEFLSGDLDAESCEKFRQHLAECPPCIVYVETYQITIELAHSLKCDPLPSDVAARLEAAMKKGMEGGEERSA
jgi:anti-sigma factor RsiW